MPRVKIASKADLAEGEMIERLHGGKQLLIACVEGSYYAMDDVCTHQGAPLHEGELGKAGHCMVTCPWHDAHFDLRTGKVQQDTPWATDVGSYPVEVEGDGLYVEL